MSIQETANINTSSRITLRLKVRWEHMHMAFCRHRPGFHLSAPHPHPTFQQSFALEMTALLVLSLL